MEDPGSPERYPAAREGAKRLPALLCLVAVWLVHAAAVFYFLPPPFAFDDAPVLFADYTVHLRSALLFRQCAAHGVTWAYDPFLMAGYPANLFEGVDNHGSELFVAAFGARHPVAAFKVWLLLGFLAFPLVIGAAAWALRVDGWTIAAGVWLAGLVWALDPHALLFREFGGVAFPLGCALALLSTGLAWRFLGSGRVGVGVAFFLVTAVAIWIHVLALLLVAFAVLLLFLTHATRGAARRIATLAAAGTLGVGPSVWWLLPVTANLPWKADSSNRLVAPGLDDLAKLLLFAPGTRFQSLLVWMGAVGLAVLARHDRRLAAWIGAGAVAAFLVAFAPLGELPPIAQLQPQRFVLSGVVLLVLPAAWLAVTAAGRFAPVARWAVLLPVVACACAFQTLPWWQLAAHAPVRAASLSDRAQVPPAVSLLRAWLRARPRDGRVLLEDMDDISNAPYGGTFIGAIVPMLEPIPLLGGPTELPYRQQVVDLNGGVWLGVPVVSLSEVDLRDRLDRYAVDWIVAVRSETVRYLDRHPAVVTRADAWGPFTTFAVRDPRSLAEGAAAVQLELGRVTVRGAGLPVTLLRLHWHQALRSVPPLPIERVAFPDDPVGLIRVHNGAVRDFVLASPGFLPPSPDPSR